MLRSVLLFCLCAFTVICSAADRIDNLPQPHYQPKESDPAWLRNTVQLHGHLGPMVSFGARMGMAGLRAVDARGYFDVEVTCEGPFAKPPESCFLDGIQISTGATLGKRNLKCIEGDRIVVRIKNTANGKTAELRPKKEFLKLLPQAKPAVQTEQKNTPPSQATDNHLNDDLARKIATMPKEEILTMAYPSN